LSAFAIIWILLAITWTFQAISFCTIIRIYEVTSFCAIIGISKLFPSVLSLAIFTFVMGWSYQNIPIFIMGWRYLAIQFFRFVEGARGHQKSQSCSYPLIMILSAFHSSFPGKMKHSGGPVLYETKDKGPSVRKRFSVELSQFLLHQRLRSHPRRRFRLRFACDAVTLT
jgi:hypothetical protein